MIATYYAKGVVTLHYRLALRNAVSCPNSISLVNGELNRFVESDRIRIAHVKVELNFERCMPYILSAFTWE